MTGFSIYGATLVLLYAASTSYHVARSPRLKRALRIFDHVSIFLLIAGTYTPFGLIFLREAWTGWTLLVLLWSIALAGLVFKMLSAYRFHPAAGALYLAMGWICVFFIQPMWAAIPLGAMALLIAGGLAYTVGMVFFGWHDLPYNHTVWHLFVLAGSVLHYCAVALYTLPAG
jgi:hemolysin III